MIHNSIVTILAMIVVLAITDTIASITITAGYILTCSYCGSSLLSLLAVAVAVPVAVAAGVVVAVAVAVVAVVAEVVE